MKKAKVFIEARRLDLENALNEWLKDHNSAKIISVTQSESQDERGWTATITILYDEGATRRK